MKACKGALFLGRALREQGHDVRLLEAKGLSSIVNNVDKLGVRLSGFSLYIAVRSMKPYMLIIGAGEDRYP